ncbi:MAG TPA: CBS domain-containing protein [Pseudogracilibacillus sp.]|nr:CBS domain-containing protein [Pseudogracilibacillus sp.]
MKIKDIMTKDVITVNESDTIEQCAKLLTTHNLSGLPVVDESGNLTGIITEGDLIRRSAKVPTPAYLEFLGGIIYLDNPNKFFDEVKKSMGLTAKEAMTDELTTISPEEEIEKAATTLVRKKIKRLPVVNEEGKLIGIVSRKDIMTHLFHD